MLPDTEGEVEAETPGARWVVLGIVPPPVLTFLVCGEAGQDMDRSSRNRKTTKAARLTQKAMTIECLLAFSFFSSTGMRSK